MTLKSSLLGFLAIIVLLFSCKKEVSDEDGKIPGQVEATWKFSSGGTQFSGEMDSAFVQTAAGFSSLTMVGSRPAGEPGELVISIVGEEIGTGQYDGQNVSFVYAESGQIVYQRVPGQPGNFTVNITEKDSAHVSGTFSGTVYDTTGQPHEVVDGSFTARIGAGSTTNPEIDGQLTVWSKQLCTDGGPIDVVVEDQHGLITEATAEAPECGDPRAATFTLPQGVYSIKATCGGVTKTYNVSIISACTKIEVVFDQVLPDDYLPLTTGSTWDFVNLNPNFSEMHRFTAGTDTIIDEKQYWMRTSPLPDTFYFRKDGHVYYEHFTVDFGGNIIDAPSIELPILYDDYAAGQSWESPPIPVRLAAINVDILAKFIYTIVDRDFSEDVGGKTYDNLIEVETVLFFKTPNSPDFVEGSRFVRKYAKGIGIVYYTDPERNNTEWGLTDYHVNP